MLAVQHPSVQFFPQGDHSQLFQNAPALQFCEHIIPKLRDQRHRGFSVRLFKKAVPVVFRAEDDALARWQLHLLLLLVPSLFSDRSMCLLLIIHGQQGRLGIYAVMGDLPLVPLAQTLKAHGAVSNLSVQCGAGVKGVCKAAHHFRVSTEANGPENLFALVFLLVDDGIRISGQTHLLRGVVVADGDQPALMAHFMLLLLPFEDKKRP